MTALRKVEYTSFGLLLFLSHTLHIIAETTGQTGCLVDDY